MIIVSCGQHKKNFETQNAASDSTVAKLIKVVTRGKIKSEDKIRVVFNKSMVNGKIENKEADNDLFTFIPAIEGKAFWKDSHTLLFVPDKPLPLRTDYSATLNLKKILDTLTAKKIENFKFAFSVMGRDVFSFKSKITLKDKNNPKLVNYRGNIIFTENTNIEDLKKAVSLTANGKYYNVELFSGNNQRTFSFISQDIVRDNSTKDFKFTIKKEPLGLSDDFVKEFQVTSVKEFKIVAVKKLTNDLKPKLRIEFSDELDFNQNLSGMITVSGLPDIKINKIGNSVVLNGNFNFGNTYKVVVEKGIRSKWGTKLKSKVTKLVTFNDIKPRIKFASDGVFLPTDNEYKLQFYSVNLKRIHVEVKRVYDNNIGEFLSNEKLNSLADRKQPFKRRYINRTGVIIYNRSFELNSEKNKELLNEIDLSPLVKEHTIGLYLVRLNFNPEDMTVKIDEDKYRYIGKEGQIYKPLIFSNIGLTCKLVNKNVYRVYATDIITGKPLEGAKLKLKSIYDNSIHFKAVTNSEGIAELQEKNWDYYYPNELYIEAEKNGQKSVLKFREMQWNVSGFNVGGVSGDVSKVKAYIYSERGVYRPGDEVNLSVIARFEKKKFPDNHPVTLSLFNPQRKKVYEITDKFNKDGFLNFNIKTKETDPTGNWLAEFNIGNKRFSHTVKIETVVPYKLKIKINPEHKRLLWNHKELKFNVTAKYLFGNPASGLPLNVDVDINKVNRRFKKFKGFVFTNPTFNFENTKQNIFKGKLDKNGQKDIIWKLPPFHNLPSALNFKLTATVTEKGGRPNTQWIYVPYEPYSHYVGIQPVKYNYARTGNDLQISTILLDHNGKPAPGRTIKYKIYRNSRYWWWWYDSRHRLKYKSDDNTVLIKEGEITSKNTHTNIHFVPIERGYYFIEVIDESGTGHSAGVFFDAYPYGGGPKGNKNAGTLALKAERNKYYVGEEAHVTFPAPKEGSILLTVERWNKILESKWYYPDGKDEMTINIPITKMMVPNVYINVSVIQPHSQSLNDRPIRTFGILPISVVDKETKHFIDIKTAPQFRPKEDFVVNLQTSDHKPTQFTIAVVDEGLLDITKFRTPDPWKFFYKKIRLAVKTYDLFSQIISVNKGDVFKTFALGGDMDYRESQLQPKKNKRRFKPVSLFKGPIFTDQNGKAVVKFKMPNYIGSVRIMVIGARNHSYAKAEKTVPVKSELMILPTLPRVIGPDEKFTIPVTVFGMKKNLGKVKVTITTQGPLKTVGDKIKTLTFNDISDQDCFFDISTFDEVGQSKVTIKATSGNYSADYTVDLMVRPSSPRIYKTENFKIAKGGNILINVPGEGIKGTNRATLTISNFPYTNFGNRLKWLIHYPYGCIEQTTSSVFPQLYIKKFIKYPEAYSEEIDKHINAGLQRLRRFQTFSGGFSYWPYGNKPSDWGTLYGGHFMVEAQNMGYKPSKDLYLNWLNFNQSRAKNHSGSLFVRVYRAFILAVDNHPELSEMNALKESSFDKMGNTQKWLLAATYKLAGQQAEADKIISGITLSVKKSLPFDETYGSQLRNKAMILYAAVVLGKYDIADKLTKEISTALSSDDWLSTQTIGYSLLAIGKYMDAIIGNKKNVLRGYIIDSKGKKTTFKIDKSVDIKITKDFGKPVKLFVDTATTTKNVYATLAWNGIPIKSNIKDMSKNLKLSVSWLDEDGNEINPSEIKQGTTFYGKFTVSNLSKLNRINEIALVQVIPSGWEIVNTRLLNESLPDWTKNTPWNRQEYLDIRDDRIMWFFDYSKYWFHEKEYSKFYFIVKLTAVTVGEYNLPATILEAMYNNNFKAYKAGKRVKVIKPQ